MYESIEQKCNLQINFKTKDDSNKYNEFQDTFTICFESENICKKFVEKIDSICSCMNTYIDQKTIVHEQYIQVPKINSEMSKREKTKPNSQRNLIKNHKGKTNLSFIFVMD